MLEKKIADKIREIRKSKGLTLAQFGEMVGLSKGLLSRIENNQVSPPIGTLSKISQGLEVTYWEPNADGLHLQIERPGHARGQFVLNLPKPLRTALINGNPCFYRGGDDGLYYFPIELNQSAKLQLLW